MFIARLLSVVAILGFIYLGWTFWRDSHHQEQADACWHYYGSASRLNNQVEECLIFRYHWSDASASREVERRRHELRVRLGADSILYQD